MPKKYYGRVTGNEPHMMSKPGTGNLIKLQKEQMVELLDTEYDKIKVSNGDQIGYMWKEQFESDSDLKVFFEAITRRNELAFLEEQKIAERRTLKFDSLKRSFGDSGRFILNNLTVKTTPLYEKPRGLVKANIEDGDAIQVIEIYDRDFVKIKLLDKNIRGYAFTNLLGISSSLAKYIDNIIIERTEEERRISEKQREESTLKAAQKRKESYEKRKSILFKKYGSTIGQKILNKEYWLGMLVEQARESQGTPDSINESVGNWGVKQQWIYTDLYLYFENGVLTSYQRRY